MRDWFQIVLLSVCETFLWGSVTFALSVRLGFSLSSGYAFGTVFIAHLLGQLIALVTTRKKKNEGMWHDSQNSGDEREESLGRGRDAAEAGAPDHAKNRMLFLWVCVLSIMGVCIWRVWEHAVYDVSWLYMEIAISVLASALGINSVTKHLDAAKATRKMVFGAMVFFVMGVFQTVPQTMILRGTICYLPLSSVLIVRQRGFEVGPGDIGTKQQRQWNRQWNTSSLIVVCVAGFMAVVLFVVLTGGKELLRDMYQLIQPILEKGFDLILLPIAYLFGWISDLLSGLIDPDNAEFAFEFQPLRDETKEMQEQNEVIAVLPQWVKLLVIGLAIVAVLVLLWRLISKTVEKPEGEPLAESRISVASTEVVKEWLDSTLLEGKQKLAMRFRQIGKFLSASEPKTIEDLYLATIDFTSKKLIPKDPSLTPFEYLEVIEDSTDSPQITDLIRTISLIFSECYYSGARPSPTQWTTALSAYRDLTRA